MVDHREEVWSDIHDLLPPGWRVPAAPMQDRATGRWRVTAVGPKRGGRRGPPPEYVTGERLEEETALVDLALKLRERQNAERLEEIDRRARLAFVDGAEEKSRPVMGRPLTWRRQVRPG